MFLMSAKTGDPCDVFRMNGQLVVSGPLTKIGDGFIVIKKVSGEITPIADSTLCKLIVGDKSKDCEAFVGLTTVLDDDTLKIEKLESFDAFDRRAFARIDVSIKTSVEADGFSAPIQAKVKNISLRGILFDVKDEKIQTGATVRFKFDWADNHVFSGVVRRKMNNPHSIGYGCSFDNLTTEEEERISSYVFEKQS